VPLLWSLIAIYPRACPGHPRLCHNDKKDMDARDEPAHDDGEIMAVSRPDAA
jgi:hypothetical protein